MIMIKRNILLPLLSVCLCACHHETLDDRAEKYTKDYTERFCPTPVQDMQRTDSLTYDCSTHTFNYYFTLVDKADNAVIIKEKQKEITDALLKQLKENTSAKVYKDAGFSFHYIFRSGSKGNILLENTFTQKQYKK